MKFAPFWNLGICLLLLTSAAPIAAQSTPIGQVVACGRVVNEVGWSIPDATVTVYGAGLDNAAENLGHLPGSAPVRPLVVTTDENGAFRLTLIRDRYVFRVIDPLGPTHPARGGAAYAPLAERHEIQDYPVSATHCPGAAHGVALPNLVLKAPGQGFIQARVVDGAAADQRPLPDVDVGLTATLAPDELDRESVGPSVRSLHTHTGADGVARLACPATSGSGNPHSLVFRESDYLDAHRSLTCRPAAVAHVDLMLWRRYVTLVVDVSNTTDLGETTPVRTPAPVGVTALPSATVAITGAPGLGSLAPTAAMCGASSATAPAVSRDNATPYVCSESTNSAGRAVLRLPWTTDGPISVTASANGHESASQPIEITPARARLRATGEPVLAASYVLLPKTWTIVHTITNVTGAGLEGATAEYSWRGNPIQNLTADATGRVSISLGPGSYHVRVHAAGFQPRDCLATITAADNGDASVVMTPAECFRLLKPGMGAIRGTVSDAERSVAIPNLEICDTPSNACTRTSATGEYWLELAHAAAYSLSVSPGQLWTKNAFLAGSAPHADRFSASNASAVDRVRVPVVVFVNGTTGPLAASDVEFRKNNVPVAGSAGATNAEGAYQFLATWTRHPTLDGMASTHDYTVKVTRHKADDHFGEATAAARVWANMSGLAVPVLLQPEGKTSTAVTVFDAHTGKDLVATVTATITSESGAVCAASAGCVVTSPGTLTLWSGHTYRICATVEPAGLYDTSAVGSCRSGVTPGPAVTINLNRTVASVAVTVRDAHTGAPIHGLNVGIAPGSATFRCQPFANPAFTCAKATDTAGEATLALPWSAGASDYCVRTIRENGNVTGLALDAPASSFVEPLVPFQAAQDCAPLETGARTLELRPLRAPGWIVPASVRNGTGAPLAADASLIPAPERAGFACNPAQHSSGGAGFPHCDGVTPDALGNAPLSLPAGNHTWRLTANATGHFNESYTGVRQIPSAALVHAFLLWPQSFDVVVRIQHDHVVGDPHACGADAPDNNLRVRLVNLENATVAIPEAFATSQADGTCEATVRVPTWNRGPTELPAGASPWPKRGDAYVVYVSNSNHAGANATILGPGQRLAHVQLQTGDTAVLATGEIRGAVTDANTALLTGLPGAQIVATRTQPCHGKIPSFRTMSRGDGAYVLPVACPGAYDVTVTHSSFYEPVTRRVVVPAGSGISPGIATEGFPLPRALGAVTFTVTKVGSNEVAPLEGVTVDLAGRDVTTDPAPGTTGALGTVTFRNLPWGAYAVTFAKPGHVIAPNTVATAPLLVAVTPGGGPSYTAIAVSI